MLHATFSNLGAPLTAKDPTAFADQAKNAADTERRARHQFLRPSKSEESSCVDARRALVSYLEGSVDIDDGAEDAGFRRPSKATESLRGPLQRAALLCSSYMAWQRQHSNELAAKRYKQLQRMAGAVLDQKRERLDKEAAFRQKDAEEVSARMRWTCI